MPGYKPSEIHSLFRHAFNAGDVGSLTPLYEPNAVLIVDGKKVIGQQNIREAFKGLVAQRGRMTLETVPSLNRQKAWQCCMEAGSWSLRQELVAPWRLKVSVPK
jgi:ketosteroid isomerase-like protein